MKIKIFCDIAELDFFPNADDFKIHPSGLSAEFDNVNGGFATQELVLLGGRRGSGKSIISLNMAINRFLDGNTVAFFTIEMRYKEVYDRVLSIISEVPFLDIFRNQLTETQKITIAKAKFDKGVKNMRTITMNRYEYVRSTMIQSNKRFIAGARIA